MVVVVLVVALVDGDGVVPEVPPLVEPGPPIELVLPDDDVSVLLELGGVPLEVGDVLLPPIALVLPPEPLLPGVVLLLLEVDVSRLGAGVVVDELDDEVVGVPV